MIQRKRLRTLFNQMHAILTGSVFFVGLIASDELSIDPMAKLLFFMVVTGIILAATALIVVWSDDLRIKPDVMDFLVLIYYVLCTVGILRSGIWFYNDKFLGLTLLVLLYSALRIAQQVVPETFIQTRNRIISIMLIGSALLQSIWGLLQFYGIIAPQNVVFQITGAFTNPSPYAFYLAACIPVTLVFYLNIRSRHTNERILGYLAGTTFALEVLSLSATQNRASWIASGLGIFLVLGKKFNLAVKVRSVLSNRKRILALTIGFTVLIGTLSTGLYLLKPDSAYGRVLRWKVSYQMMEHGHFWGYGYSMFQKEYNDAQSSWFSKRHRDAKDVMIAGDQRYAYNDYLETAIELGIPGLMILLLIILIALKRLFSGKSRGYGNSDHLYGITLLSICAMALFAYPLSSLPTQIIFFFVLAHALQERAACPAKKTSTFKRFCYSLIILLTVGLVVVFTSRYYGIYSSAKKWQYAKYSQQLGQLSGPINLLTSLYPVLRFNGEYLKDYGICLHLNGNYHQSITQLKRATDTVSDPQLYIALGDSYQKVNDLKAAAESYSIATNMVPGRLFPKYKLILVSIKMNNQPLVCRLAREIIDMQIKVQSPAALQIKEEMQIILQGSCR